MIDKAVTAQVADAINRQRLLQTATALVEVPSPTGDARAVADRLAELLKADGFATSIYWTQKKGVVAI